MLTTASTLGTSPTTDYAQLTFKLCKSSLKQARGARHCTRGYRVRVVSYDNQVALVTGANTGMGKYTAQELARSGYEVIMACRDEAKGLQAAEEVAKATGGRTRFEQLDLGSLESIAACSQRLVQNGRPINRLINNAGIMACPPWTTSDGFEAQMGTNHLGHFAFTLQVLPLLAEAGEEAPARIVNVASAAHSGCKELDTDDLGVLNLDTYTPWGNYGASKAANILFTRELARRLEENSLPITVNSLCPGFVATDLGRHLVAGSKWYMKPVMSLMVPVMLKRAKSIPDGASTALFLAQSETVEGTSGEYFVDSVIKSSSDLAQDMQLASKLWDASQELTGIKMPSISR